MDAELGGIVDMQPDCALSYATRGGHGSGEDAVPEVVVVARRHELWERGRG